MAMRGQRFHINLSSDEETDALKPSRPLHTATASSLPGLLGEIKERSFTSDARPPSPPRITKNDPDTGFPAHRKRRGPSAFKRSKAADQSSHIQDGSHSTLPSTNVQGIKAGDHEVSPSDRSRRTTESKTENEKQSIDEENKRRIANMSPAEIEAARAELLTGLSSSLIERLLRNANIDDDAVNLIDPPESGYQPIGQSHPEAQLTQKPSFDIPDATPSSTKSTLSNSSSTAERSLLAASDLPPANPPPDLHPASIPPSRPKLNSSTFPPPPPLDASSPSFLSDLHATYFPSLPANPSALAWMAPLPPSTSTSTSSSLSNPSPSTSTSLSDYSPSRPSLPPSSLRFDFRGHLLPPRLAAQIPTTKGLHHHSIAPEAAGYTIPELARLAHSAVPSQRCIAYQTLGRFLYRLGRGDFGQDGEELCEGLWAMVEEGEVLDLLVREAAKGGDGAGDGAGVGAGAGVGVGGNRTCWVTATEAVWLWRKGGGKRWRAE